ncbi:Orotidine-5'-phosphate decarboxylase (PyrF) (PDB:1DBT) [Commensalibacter communis]|uniref:orotidine-5'-phosphate decarboxylase n=1 Tax=Commensalibacter communis TaxID=2972786 RepID=UPI0022FF75B2|nr:orotidine-5'-phosphate decarboxylase [Commensalibacter communis]CAI3948687.1 Orotidine-5'-phosphate decarboxylase (PyrF) (PDB:1DBT) [Commensalibacter communis]
MIKNTGLILALDTKDPVQAEQWAKIADATGQMIKIGMEYTYACGFDEVCRLAQGRKIFLDLKLHDIPNTVASAIASLAPVKPAMLTVHALGGQDMIRAARRSVDEHFPSDSKPILLAVTILTSMNQENLGSIGISVSPLEQVLLLGKMALAAGADGLVCSPHEVAYLREQLGDDVVLVVPGIRMADAAADDQQRVMTPIQAHQAGASWIVVGRPITRAENPAGMAKQIIHELQG